jgi:hypothetical protein
MTLVTRGTGAFNAAIKAWEKKLRKRAEAVTGEMAMAVLTKIVNGSPQYTGDYVANWNLSVGAPDFSFDAYVFKTPAEAYKDPSQMGDAGAINRALGNAGRGMRQIRLGQSVYLANGAEHGDPYAWKIEAGAMNFRPMHQGVGIPGLVKRTPAEVASQFNGRKL